MDGINYIYYDKNTLSDHYNEFLQTARERGSSANKIKSLIRILTFISKNYKKFDEDELRDARNICLVSRQLLAKIDTYKSLKLPEKEACRSLLCIVEEKIKSSK